MACAPHTLVICSAGSNAPTVCGVVTPYVKAVRARSPSANVWVNVCVASCVGPRSASTLTVAFVSAAADVIQST